MEKDRSRAIRRHHYSRMKRRGRWLLRLWGKLNGIGGKDPDGAAGVLATTRVPCSCWMCGNPRHYGEVSLAEKRADEAHSLDNDEGGIG